MLISAASSKVVGRLHLPLPSSRRNRCAAVWGCGLPHRSGRGAWTLRPSVEAQWQRELRSRPESRIEAIFLQGGTPIFTLPSTRYDRDGAVVGAGISAVYGERTALRLSYSGEFANDRRIHGFAITANHRF
ncbi:autotransporter domain-containing protein [Novosphingobium resinovorum]|uniref:autotransporter outer membrane beta-barrel domain-containing protein n=1 Tax=Novosphingobium resinovorum TaxID=158500 RepID=UPI00361B5E61